MSSRRLALTAATVALAAVVASAPAPTAARHAPVSLRLALAGAVRPAAVPADCSPVPSGPPFQFEALITVTNGTLVAGPVSVSGIDATACAVVQLVSGTGGCPATGTVTAPADGQQFSPLTAVLGLVPGQPVQVPAQIVPHPISGSFGCASSVNGLVISVNASVEAETAGPKAPQGLFGVICHLGPQAVTLQGVLGSPATPATSFDNIPGTISGTIPLPQATVSPTCPQGVATNLDQLAGLPATAQINLPFVAALVQAGTA